MGKYTDIQNAVIRKYRVDLCDGTKCRNDWSRTHAHVKQRRVCKWKQANSLESTFTLLHEIGHIETTQGWMRRAEEEFWATIWAIEVMWMHEMDVPKKILDEYQRYINMEKERGIRRGGKEYGRLLLADLTEMWERKEELWGKWEEA